MVCGNFILPEFCKPCLFLYLFQFAQLILPYPYLTLSIHAVTLKQIECRKKNKKTAAAGYLYQADNDGEWGELRFDFENGTAEIVRLADWDTVKSNVFAKTAIRYVQKFPTDQLPDFAVISAISHVFKNPFPADRI